jgi:A/G-specific adenine glycosylase
LRESLPARLLAWFDQNRRPLPWRRNRDPYAIWLAEVMLQQTQVATVIPYFERFLTAFPDIASLAAAAEQDVLRLWEGLGYYRRARDLHAAARLLVERHSGQMPREVAAVAELPGMGPYTRNAVLSQAFDLRLPILEANSQRVLSRLFGRRDDPRTTPARQWLWAAAEELLPEQRAGDFNQALMELGALVCTPTAPACDRCPLAGDCRGRASGTPEMFPERMPAQAITEVSELALVIRRAERVLLVQRPANATRWANLWEFPHAEIAATEPVADAITRLARELVGLNVRPGPEVVTLKHGVTRFRITLTCHEAAWVAGEFASDFYTAGQWLTVAELAAHPVSAPQRRLATVLAKQGRQQRLF